MTTIGYARVSTTDQDLAIQITALKAAGCEVIRSEKRSGTTTEGRAELQTVSIFSGLVTFSWSPGSIGSPAARRPAGHCEGSTGSGRGPEGHGTANRHHYSGG
jgi:hypothetical protein